MRCRGRGQRCHRPADRQARHSSSRRDLLFGILNAWTPTQVLELCGPESVGGLDADLASLAVHRIAKSQADEHVWRPGRAWSALLVRLKDTAVSAGVPHVCKAVWALAKAPIRAASDTNFIGALEALELRAEALAVEFDVQGVANMLWSLATLQLQLSPSWVARKRLLKSLAIRGIELMPQFQARDVANSLWAAARLRRPSLAELRPRLVGRLAEVAASLNPQELTNCLWAVATMHAAGELTGLPKGLRRSLCRSVSDLVGSFNAQNVSNAIWALGKLQRGDETGGGGSAQERKLSEALEARAAIEVKGLTPQGLTNFFWGLAKLGARLTRASAPPLLRAVATHAPDLNEQNASNLLWALSILLGQPPNETGEYISGAGTDTISAQDTSDTLAVAARASIASLFKRLGELAHSLSDCDVACVLLGSAKLQECHRIDPAFLEDVCSRGAQVVQGLHDAQVVWTLWSLAKLGVRWEVAGLLPHLLGEAVITAVPSLPDQELGVTAWALAVCGAPKAAGRPIVEELWRVARVLAARPLSGAATADFACPLGWRTVGHLLFAERRICVRVKSHSGLSAKVFATANCRSQRGRLHVEEAVVEQVGAYMRTKVYGTECALLYIDDEEDWAVNRDGGWGTALLGNVARTCRWRRFACGDEQAHAWPRLDRGDEGDAESLRFGACILHAPFSAGALRYALAAVAASLRRGGLIVVWGEGVAGAARAQQAALTETGFDATEVLVDARSAAVVCARWGTGIATQPSQLSCRQEVHVKLPLGANEVHEESKWCTYPGLFAGGGLDIMTAELLRALPGPPALGAKVLDFACGSGLISAALLRRAPGTELTLLDADAVALEACRENVPGARRLLISDGWRALEGRRLRFDWIVSNPPVHWGRADDFSVLLELVHGAGPRLRPGGVLWIVAQEYVPVGGLLGDFSDVSCPFDDGRFVVWRAAGWQGRPAQQEPLWWRLHTQQARRGPDRRRKGVAEGGPQGSLAGKRHCAHPSEEDKISEPAGKRQATCCTGSFQSVASAAKKRRYR